MATYNIYSKALQMLKDREKHYENKAHESDSYTAQQCALSSAGAYHSAWWILYCAIHEAWDTLEQYDNFKEGE